MLIDQKSLIVAGLRAAVLIAKFFFTVFLARVLTIEEFGLWVLVVAGIGYGVFLIGAEIYNITLRNYVNNGTSGATGGLSKQWFFFVAIYLTVLLTALGLELSQSSSFSWFILTCALILIFEHSTQEIHRIAIYCNSQIHANMLLFIKSVGWMLPTVSYTFSGSNPVSLSLVLQAWLYGGAVALIYGVYVYWNMAKSLRFPRMSINLKKITDYVKILIPFWVLALAIRTPLILDRYFLELFADREQLSIYGYYMSFGNGVQAMFDALVLSKLIPELLNNNVAKSIFCVRRLLKKYISLSLGFWIVSLSGLYFIIPFFNDLTNKSALGNYDNLLLLISFGQMTFSLAVLIQYGLYALRRDQDLTNGAVMYLTVNIALFILLIPIYGNIGAALSMSFSALILLSIRAFQIIRILR